MKFPAAILLGLALLFSVCSNAFAIYDPLSVPNNKYGIHIVNENDLQDAANLVNSGGGDWGYVTLVITKTERDTSRWQRVFDQMRRSHIIPIVRIATKPVGDLWETPNENDIDSWVSFLNSLNWVTENRYIVVLNEPNHSSEWGGTIDPASYAKYLKDFSQKLKATSPDYFVLPAGLDASAKNTPITMDETKFLRAMIKVEPDIFNYIDGWTSHSYPNPDFAGSETAKGKGTVGTFDWESNYLKTLGLTKELPIFITETGWSNDKLSEDQISTKLQYTFQNVWNDPRIVAVTPFILNYTNPPFNNFSWEKQGGGFFKFYEDVAKLPKVTGVPKQIEQGSILAAFAQPVILPNSEFAGVVIAKNTGQSIWSQNNTFLGSDSGNVVVGSLAFNAIEPPNVGVIIFKALSPQKTGLYSESVYLKNSKNQRTTNSFALEGFVVKLIIPKLSDILPNLRTLVNLK